jgi:hypothetical protein
MRPCPIVVLEVTTAYTKAVTSRTMPPVTGRDAVRGTRDEAGQPLTRRVGTSGNPVEFLPIFSWTET